jgi:hypothetical protein
MSSDQIRRQQVRSDTLHRGEDLKDRREFICWKMMITDHNRAPTMCQELSWLLHPWPQLMLIASTPDINTITEDNCVPSTVPAGTSHVSVHLILLQLNDLYTTMTPVFLDEVFETWRNEELGPKSQVELGTLTWNFTFLSHALLGNQKSRTEPQRMSSYPRTASKGCCWKVH